MFLYLEVSEGPDCEPSPASEASSVKPREKRESNVRSAVLFMRFWRSAANSPCTQAQTGDDMSVTSWPSMPAGASGIGNAHRNPARVPGVQTYDNKRSAQKARSPGKDRFSYSPGRGPVGSIWTRTTADTGMSAGRMRLSPFRTASAQ